MTSDWLHAYLAESVRRKLCTEIGSTTCGAMEFRMGVRAGLDNALGADARRGLDREAVIEIAKALAGITPDGSESHVLVPAARCLLFDLYTGMPFLDNDIEALLADSWAGGVLQAMKEHHAARQAERQAHAQSQDPAYVEQRRAEKKRVKQEQHAQRLILKKERDRAWREANGSKK